MNFKLTILLLCVSMFSSCSTISGQKKYFEGKINYKVTCTIKTGKADTAYCNRIFSKTTELSFKEGNFFEKYDRGILLWQLYNTQENRTYIRENQPDTVHWIDCGNPDKKILRTELNRNKEKILGIECDELVNYYENKTISFYFNPDTLRLDPEWYKNFNTGSKYKNYQKMKAIYLQYKLEYPDIIVTVTATRISPQKIEDKTFNPPIGNVMIEDK